MAGQNNQLDNVGERKKVSALLLIFSNSFNVQNSHIIFDLLLRSHRHVASKEDERCGIRCEDKNEDERRVVDHGGSGGKEARAMMVAAK